MYLLNLSFLQFGAVFGSIAAVSVALYLLDRSRRRQVVSTLRFWVAAEQPAVAARRRHIQQPWSLILQLVSMALLLLAIAQLRFGSPAQAGRDHVIVLETSSWMAARVGRPHLDGRRPAARPPVLAGPPAARSRDAGAGRRSGHSRHGVRARPPQSGGRHPGFAAGLHGAQPGPGALVRAPHSGAGRAARRRDRLRRAAAAPPEARLPARRPRRPAICAC